MVGKKMSVKKLLYFGTEGVHAILMYCVFHRHFGNGHSDYIDDGLNSARYLISKGAHAWSKQALSHDSIRLSCLFGPKLAQPLSAATNLMAFDLVPCFLRTRLSVHSSTVQ